MNTIEFNFKTYIITNYVHMYDIKLPEIFVPNNCHGISPTNKSNRKK